MLLDTSRNNELRRLRYMIPYVLVMGLIVGKQAWATGNHLNLLLAVLSLPCAVALWRYASRAAVAGGAEK